MVGLIQRLNTMNHKFVRVRERHKVTLPPEVVKALRVGPGDVVEFSSAENGQVEIRAARILRAGTPEARREEKQAMAEVGRGEVSAFDSVEKFMEHVDSLRPGAESDLPILRPAALSEEQQREVWAIAEAAASKMKRARRPAKPIMAAHEVRAAEHS